MRRHLFLLLFSLLTANAQYSDAVCGQGFSWMSNDLSQSPCQVASSILSGCINGPYNLWALPAANYAYPGPTQTNSTAFAYNQCLCSMPIYNLLSACADCQGSSWVGWERHIENCNSSYTGDNEGGRVDLPITVPTNTMLMPWMTVNPLKNTTNGEWSETLSRQLATAGSSSSNPITGSSSSKNANTGIIIGAVLGGVALLSVIVFAFWFLHSKTKASSPRPRRSRGFRFGRIPSEREVVDGDYPGMHERRNTWFGLSGFRSVRKPGAGLGREKSQMSSFSTSGGQAHVDSWGTGTTKVERSNTSLSFWKDRPDKNAQQTAYHVVDTSLPQRRIDEPETGDWGHKHDSSMAIASGYRSFRGNGPAPPAPTPTSTGQNQRELRNSPLSSSGGGGGTPKHDRFASAPVVLPTSYVDPYEQQANLQQQQQQQRRAPSSPNLMHFMPPEPQEPDGPPIDHRIASSAISSISASSSSAVGRNRGSIGVQYASYPPPPKSISSLSVQYPSLPSSPAPPLPPISPMTTILERSREPSITNTSLRTIPAPLNSNPLWSPASVGQSARTAQTPSPQFANVSRQDSLYNQRVSEAVAFSSPPHMIYQTGYVPGGGAASPTVQFPNGRGGFGGLGGAGGAGAPGYDQGYFYPPGSGVS
ncbi:hypothetical protein BT69DRAFT_1323419 [Atractiella rhizophila]|nr:hypothetical protein BT69DRAFT_1323419 [Atractiella rhizophila]